MQALVARCREHAELMEGGHKGPVLLPQLIDAESSQHPSDKEEIALWPNLAIKYGFILRSDLPEFLVARNAITGGPDAKPGGDRNPRRLRQGRHNRSNQNQIHCEGDGYTFAKPGFSQKALREMALQQTTFRNSDTATGVASSGVNALKKWVIRSRLARVSPAARTMEKQSTAAVPDVGRTVRVDDGLRDLTQQRN
jgi:hypothetical protein